MISYLASDPTTSHRQGSQQLTAARSVACGRRRQQQEASVIGEYATRTSRVEPCCSPSRRIVRRTEDKHETQETQRPSRQPPQSHRCRSVSIGSGNAGRRLRRQLDRVQRSRSRIVSRPRPPTLDAGRSDFERYVMEPKSYPPHADFAAVQELHRRLVAAA